MYCNLKFTIKDPIYANNHGGTNHMVSIYCASLIYSIGVTNYGK